MATKTAPAAGKSSAVDKSSAVVRHARTVARLVEARTQVEDAAATVQATQQELAALDAREAAAAAKTAKARQLVLHLEAAAVSARARELIDADSPEASAAAAHVADVAQQLEQARALLAASEAEAATLHGEVGAERERLQAEHSAHTEAHTQRQQLAEAMAASARDAQAVAGQEVSGQIRSEYAAARQRVAEARTALDSAYSEIQQLSDAEASRLAPYGAAAALPTGPQLRSREAVEHSRALYEALERHKGRMAPVLGTAATYLALPPEPVMRLAARDVSGMRDPVAAIVLGHIKRALGEQK